MSVRKLTEEQVHEIYCLNRKRVHYKGLADVYSIKNIANRMGVSPTTILSVLEGTSYAEINDPECDI